MSGAAQHQSRPEASQEQPAERREAKPKVGRKPLPGTLLPRGKDAEGVPRWLIRWYVGRDAIGKRHYEAETVSGTKKEARQLLEENRAKARRNKGKPGKRQTLGQFYTDWLASKRDIEPNTRSQYEARYEQDVKPFLGNIDLRDITPQLVQKWVDWLRTERKLSPRTTRYSVGVLKQMLRLAFRWQLVVNVATEGVELPKSKHKEQLYLTPEQIIKLLDVATGKAPDKGGKYNADSWAPLWALLLTGGLRPQEALALEVTDLQGSRVIISKAVKRNPDDSVYIGATKTGKSRRTVSLPESTVKLLKEHLKPNGTIAGLIFRNQSNGLVDISKLRKYWAQACKRAKVPVVRLYDARHSHITALLAAGVSLKVASERAGHASVKMTGDIYSHVMPEMDSRAAEVMEALLTGKA